MLKKLYRYEFYSLFRSMLPIYIGIMGLAAFSRIFMIFDVNSYLFEMFQNSVQVLFLIGLIAVFVLGFILIIRRFYTNLLSHEGYLTFTLPFKASQHIICKLLCAVAVMIISSVFEILAVCIFLSGRLGDIAERVITPIKQYIEYVGVGGFVFYVVTIVIYILAALSASILMTYVSMAIGQQFKNRIAASVIAYGVIYAILQTIGLMIVAIGIIIDISKWAMENEAAVFLVLLIIYQLVFCTAYYLVTRYMLTKKLNLA